MIIELFKQITKIPRCSGIHSPFISFVQNFCLIHDFVCKVDKSNNILCYKKDLNSTICLQSHYDIVCLEDKKVPQIMQKGNLLFAKDSTLGADNGIGCAYMLQLMSENINCEYLFTSDEEIGLIGANNIDFDIKSQNMLNLDSESMGEVCIGCAGGIDIFATNTNSKLKQNINNKSLYEIEVSGLSGGHSGVDINKNIPNAIKLLAQVFKTANDVELLDINGGERINSIAKYAKALILSSSHPQSTNEYVKVKKITNTVEHYKSLDTNIISFINELNNGVLKFDEELNVVIDSINIAIIKTNTSDVQISLSARSMNNENLKLIASNTTNNLKKLDFSVSTDGKYPAWKPDTNEFTKKVLKHYKNHFQKTTLYAIHAGLECAIFKHKYPHLNIASIGPNINFPHSNRENCEISSVNKVYDILKEIVK